MAPERIAQLVLSGLPDEFPELRVGAESDLGDRAEWVSLPGYEVREKLGKGAFGVVWKAYQPSEGREVAVKLIRPELASRPSFVRRFEAEARTIARLGHPTRIPPPRRSSRGCAPRGRRRSGQDPARLTSHYLGTSSLHRFGSITTTCEAQIPERRKRYSSIDQPSRSPIQERQHPRTLKRADRHHLFVLVLKNPLSTSWG